MLVEPARAAGSGAPVRVPNLVSVIVPVFNGERYVATAIQSALSQTYRPLEVIVVNDGSTDGTAAVLQTFGETITIVTQPNRGLAGARNRGIAAAKGEFLAFLDADDLWEPDKVARQVEVFKSRPDSVFVHTGKCIIDAEDHVIRTSDTPGLEGHCLAQLVAGNVITASSVMVRATEVPEPMFAEGIPGVEDWDLWLRLAARGPVGYIASPLTRYRVHDANMSWNAGPMMRSTLRTVDRLLARESDASVRNVARVHRRRILFSLAHIDYEHGSYIASRRWFRAAGLPMERRSLQRYVACFLPSWLRTPLRLAYRAVSRRQAPVA